MFNLLYCSSTNAKKWETELQTLKNNNARLTAALQESTTNVEEWKKQLNAYKEENIRLRKKVHTLIYITQITDFTLLENSWKLKKKFPGKLLENSLFPPIPAKLPEF